MADFLDSWFDGLTLLLTLVTVLVQMYAVAVALRISPKEMHVYRYFLCACTVCRCTKIFIIYSYIIPGIFH
jgi:hypothetical protein